MEKNVQKQNVLTNDDIITYLADGSVQVLMNNILTIDHVIYPGMIVLKAEGIHYDSITILEIWDNNGILYIKIKNNKTGKVGTISKRIGIDYNIWTLISYEYFAEEFLFKKRNKGTEFEFDF
jgi:hypothetical protein